MAHVDAGQKKFLVSLLFMAAVGALLFQCVIKPIHENAESAPERELESARQEKEAARAGLLARKDEILLAREKWRSDVLEAGATGNDGVVPPLITLRRNDAGEFMVTNITSVPICLRMWRTKQEQRCELGPRNVCTSLAPGQTLEFSAPGSDGACRGSGFEFRIGKEVTTDLAWWSESALDDFDRTTELLRDMAPPNNEELRRAIKQAADYLAEEDMADRWRAVLDPLNQVQLDSMLNQQNTGEAEFAPP